MSGWPSRPILLASPSPCPRSAGHGLQAGRGRALFTDTLAQRGELRLGDPGHRTRGRPHDPVTRGHRAPPSSANSQVKRYERGFLGAVGPRTHHDRGLTCEYVMGTNVVGVKSDWFPQIRAIGVQVGCRSRNGNASGKPAAKAAQAMPSRVRIRSLNRPARRRRTPLWSRGRGQLLSRSRFAAVLEFGAAVHGSQVRAITDTAHPPFTQRVRFR